MARKKYTTEDIIRLLRQAEVELARASRWWRFSSSWA